MNEKWCVAREAVDAIVAHAREAAPAECCGLLVGSGWAIGTAVRARNISEDPSRFQIDPADHIAARRAARSRGAEILGFYHSHPHSDARPSATDLAEASYRDELYMIVSLLADEPECRAYQLEDEGFRDVPFAITAR